MSKSAFRVGVRVSPIYSLTAIVSGKGQVVAVPTGNYEVMEVFDAKITISTTQGLFTFDRSKFNTPELGNHMKHNQIRPGQFLVFSVEQVEGCMLAAFPKYHPTEDSAKAEVERLSQKYQKKFVWVEVKGACMAGTTIWE